MRIGKILSLIAGIITLLATFLLSWYSIDEGGITIYYAGGLGIIKNLPAMFTDAQGLGTTLGIPLEITWSCYRGGKSPCGKCESCLRRERAYRKLKT